MDETPGESRASGWSGLPFVEPDGRNWPLDVAARLFEIPEKDLRDLVRILDIPPAGVMRMSSYSRRGRQPRAYPASVLAQACTAIADLRELLRQLFFPVPADSF